MVLKKERGRFSLRFNGNDPVQRTAIELLEQQPPHSKSQYIANALVYYNTHYANDPKPLKVPVIDRTAIEAIVLEIMQRRAQNRLCRRLLERTLGQPDAGSGNYCFMLPHQNNLFVGIKGRQ